MDGQPEQITRLNSTEERAAATWHLGTDGRYYSPDGRYWWDGRIWQPVPRGRIGRWATAHAAAYPFIVAIVVGLGWGAMRLAEIVVFGGAFPSTILLAYWAGVPGVIAWFVARGQLKRWGAR